MAIVKDRKFETDAIARRLAKANVGETITFAELSTIAGTRVGSDFSPLNSARRIVLNEDKIVFESVRGVGIKRLSDEELSLDRADRNVRKQQRSARRALKELTCVENFSSMTNHAQLSHTIKASFFGAVAWMAEKNRLNEIARAAAGRSTELPVKETLKAFIGE